MAKKNRLDKTLADYVVIAISPALIMTLVGSLVFFLLDVSYRGQFESRIHWIMFWYVFAAVLVARLAIEQGREQAQIYSIAMCVLAAIAVFRFVDAVVVGWLLLGVVWWCSSKLTWDCTLIDESVDGSGEGLLQTAGFEKSETPEVAETNLPGRQNPKDSKTHRKKKKSKKDSVIDREDAQKPAPDDSLADDAEKDKSQPHAPGLWVVYFSLAALPLFGVGQLFIPAEETGRRSYEFVLLAVYVASAIMLLLTTSFLSLRRYLRQRKLEMPASMTRAWLGMGTVLLLLLLLAALVVPCPQGEYTLTGMIDKIDARARQASRFAMLKGDRAEGEGVRKGDQDPAAKQPRDGQPANSPDKRQQNGENQGDSQQGKQNDGNGKGENQSNSKQSGDRQGKDQQSGAQQDQSRDQSGQPDKKNDGNQDVSQSKEKQKANEQQKADGRQSENRRQSDQKQNGDQDRNADKGAKPTEVQSKSPSPPTSSNLSVASVIQSMAPFVKWIIYGLLALVGIYFLIRHWSRIAEFLAKLWAELLSLFVSPPKEKVEAQNEHESTPPRLRPFASYENPFYSGAADRMTPPQLIRYTFEALEAWSREQAIERPPEQTPLEFAQELSERVPTLAKEVAMTAQLYAHIAYARKVPSRDRLEVLERLWRKLVA